MNDSRNVILAIVLSVAVLFGWQYFFAGPAAERSQKAADLAQQQQQAQATHAAATSATVGGAVVPDATNGQTFKTTAEAVAATPRIKVETPSLTGSINLTGGRLDDLKLRARGSDNLMPILLECVKAYATEGEIMAAFKEVFGVYREPILF